MNRFLRPARAALALGLVLVACGDPNLPGGGSAASPTATPTRTDGCGEEVVHGDGPDASVSYSPCPGEDDTAGGGPKAQPVEPVPGQVDVRAVSWERARAKGQTVRIFFWSGVEPCNVLDRVEVEETSREIILTLFEGRTPSDEDTACIEIAVYKVTEVDLESSAGDRKIVDGAAARE